MSIQDRTTEFHALTTSASKKLSRNNPSSAHARLLSNGKGEEKPRRQGGRGEFARRAMDIGRAITDTMGKLERLAMLAKRKALFDDKPVEIAELTYVIKQDLSSINAQISSLQALTRSKSINGKSEEGEHSKNVVVMLQGKLADVSVGFKEVLEVRTKNIQASRHRTDQFVSNVRSNSADRRNTPRTPASAPLPSSSSSMGFSSSSAYHPATANNMPSYHSPLYATPSSTPRPATQPDLLSLDPTPAAASAMNAQQLALMEEGSAANSYISARSEAIEAIEKTITELGGIFSQLAQMVGEQSEMIQRIDHETEDVVANVEGGQRELLKYWARF
ncbi:uncharacterized protein H6S33_000123 [Morchella sextelata]|uniref:uncharacterized protein n=1 Tax=Morchella sextelata TaxID=1174677 RepID=UPI001D052E7B|nr:uncharacterized protein H6S33_000123 [Morchella sextelata]KAH0614487.1 hypothetical protein H6S33_000123 [Morchella sextelata]